MKKMPCLFERDFSVRPPKLLATVTPGCEWVLQGEGMATRKWDGSAVAVINGELYARYDAKGGKKAPEGAISCDEPDSVTGHHPHWIKADRQCDIWLREAFQRLPYADGTYEAVGPKIGSNKEGVEFHTLKKHGDTLVLPVRTFEGIREFLEDNRMEGVVFQHPDGRMCKIRRHDYRMEW